MPPRRVLWLKHSSLAVQDAFEMELRELAKRRAVDKPTERTELLERLPCQAEVAHHLG
jgi:hypothetical protein